MSLGVIGLVLLLNLSPYGPAELRPGLCWEYAGTTNVAVRLAEVRPVEGGLDLNVEVSSGGFTYVLRATLNEDRRSLTFREEMPAGGEARPYELALPALTPDSRLDIPEEQPLVIEAVRPFSTATPVGPFPEVVKVVGARPGDPTTFALLLSPGTGLLAIEAGEARRLELTSFGVRESLRVTRLSTAAPELPVRAGDFELREVRFEPVAQGKNSITVQIRNLGEEPRAFTVHIYSRSRFPGGLERGWGTGFSRSLAAGEEKQCSFSYLLWGSPESSWVRARIYNLPSADALSVGDAYATGSFFELRRSGSEIEQRAPEPTLPAPPGLAATVLQRFARFQSLLAENEYEDAWGYLTRGHQEAGFQGGSDSFARMMGRTLPALPWSRGELMRLEPVGVETMGELAVMRAPCGEGMWRVDFAEEEGQWRVDWVHGRPDPRSLGRQWQEALLPLLQHHATAHFDIYYAAGTLAEENAHEIARTRESGYQAVRDFLGVQDDVRIRLIFFDDEESKAEWTWHRGVGWAFGTTIVEVYNDDVQLEPFHEATHILAASVGYPPAIFNEGLAVYMSELLGAPALEDLGGGSRSVYQRVQELRADGEWIPLRELLTYTEIGSRQSRSTVAYPEAGAFVKFLADTYGREVVLELYGSLVNSSDRAVQQENERVLERICGTSVGVLEREWQLAMGVPCEPAEAAE